MIQQMIAKTVRETAVAAANVLHRGDPHAASMAVADAMQSVLATRLTLGDSVGIGDSQRSTPNTESKLTQEAIL